MKKSIYNYLYVDGLDRPKSEIQAKAEEIVENERLYGTELSNLEDGYKVVVKFLKKEGKLTHYDINVYRD